MENNRKHRRRANGFTMLEVMVALAIFSLAAMALIRLQGFSLRSSSNVIAHEMTWQVARNRMAEILSDPAPIARGETNGTEENGGVQFSWSQNVKATDDARFVRIDLTVTGRDGGQAVLRFAKNVAQ